MHLVLIFYFRNYSYCSRFPLGTFTFKAHSLGALVLSITKDGLWSHSTVSIVPALNLGRTEPVEVITLLDSIVNSKWPSASLILTDLILSPLNSSK